MIILIMVCKLINDFFFFVGGEEWGGESVG